MHKLGGEKDGVCCQMRLSINSITLADVLGRPCEVVPAINGRAQANQSVDLH